MLEDWCENYFGYMLLSICTARLFVGPLCRRALVVVGNLYYYNKILTVERMFNLHCYSDWLRLKSIQILAISYIDHNW